MVQSCRLIFKGTLKEAITYTPEIHNINKIMTLKNCGENNKDIISMKITKICVLGLGYVGLPLALALSKNFEVMGFDVNSLRVSQLNNNIDSSGEIADEELKQSNIIFTTDPTLLREAGMIIACVPTPIDSFNKPDMGYLESASKVIAENLSIGTIVVYESTVYPGVTEELCVPIIEKYSGLKFGVDFKIGYSPERMNPGDKEHTIGRITKIVSGMDAESLAIIDYVYSTITTTHKASSIKVAEAAKVIENIQRDLNIALMNELEIIFDKMGINTLEVIEAASTKWNFHQYKPGLVGGHCIGVDPYYLTYKAQELGYHPEVILAGRRINDNMHKYYADKIIKKLQSTGGKSVMILGVTFKPDVSDCRNSRVKHLIKELKSFNYNVYAYDPYVEQSMIEQNFEATWFNIEENMNPSGIDLFVLATEHKKLLDIISQDYFPKEKLVSLRRAN